MKRFGKLAALAALGLVFAFAPAQRATLAADPQPSPKAEEARKKAQEHKKEMRETQKEHKKEMREKQADHAKEMKEKRQEHRQDMKEKAKEKAKTN